MSRPYQKNQQRRRGGGRPSGGNNNTADESGQSNPLVMLLKLIIEKYSDKVQLGPTTLNLSSLSQYEELKGQLVDFNTMKTCDALCICLNNHFPGKDNIALDCNKIRDPSTILQAMKRQDMNGSFKGISLRGNPIKDYGFLNVLKAFPALQELRCMETPISRDAGYRRQVSKLVPNLLLLDGEPLERFTLALPWPRHPGGNAPEGARNMAIQLMTEYFSRVESGEVDGLAQLYHPSALMSLCVSPTFTLNPSRGASGADMKEMARMQNELSQTRNRNLLKASSTSAIINRVAKGYIDVVAVLKRTLYSDKLTVHHIVLPDHVTVSEPAQGAMKHPVLILKIHGTLEWVASSTSEQATKRLFDRTMVLTSSPEGNNVVITNDMIHLRAFDTAPVWNPRLGDRSMKLQKKYGLPGPVAEEVIGSSENDAQCFGVAEMVKLTRMKPEIAQMCLKEARNNVTAAMDLFETKRAMLGPEHFCA
eukprot:PhM_4_TR13651/c0_g1_i1/m.15894/K14284/NXF, TAP, MEX67; nuclear RNA export factor